MAFVSSPASISDGGEEKETSIHLEDKVCIFKGALSLRGGLLVKDEVDSGKLVDFMEEVCV